MKVRRWFWWQLCRWRWGQWLYWNAGYRTMGIPRRQEIPAPGGTPGKTRPGGIA